MSTGYMFQKMMTRPIISLFFLCGIPTTDHCVQVKLLRGGEFTTMGYAMAFSGCYCCHKPFMYHPHRVPSFRDENGELQPICRGCMDKMNELRRQKGLEPFEILDGAYDPCPEEEL